MLDVLGWLFCFASLTWLVYDQWHWKMCIWSIKQETKYRFAARASKQSPGSIFRKDDKIQGKDALEIFEWECECVWYVRRRCAPCNVHAFLGRHTLWENMQVEKKSQKFRP